MTEVEIASQVPTWQMPLVWQEVSLYLFGASAAFCLVVGIWLAFKQRSWMPLVCFVSAVLTVNLEPIIARVSSASHAQIGQIVAFVSEGRSIPWYVVLVYTAYFGFGYYFLVPALQLRRIASRNLWASYLFFVVVAWCFEAPFIKAGMWDYFGPQSLKPFGLMPMYFSFVNVTSSYAACGLLAATLSLLSGKEKLWLLLLGPTYTIGVHFAVSWPIYNLRTIEHEIIGSHVGAFITIVLCLLSTHLLVRAFSAKNPTNQIAQKNIN